MILSRGCWMFIQATSRDMPHCNVARGRSHGGVLMETAMGMTDGKDGMGHTSQLKSQGGGKERVKI